MYVDHLCSFGFKYRIDVQPQGGVGIDALTQGTFTNDQTDAVSQLLLSMLGAVYQFERNIMLERQREGIAIAKAKGRYKGRPKSVDRSTILTLLDDGVSMRKTANRLGVSLSTVQRVKIENTAYLSSIDP